MDSRIARERTATNPIPERTCGESDPLPTSAGGGLGRGVRSAPALYACVIRPVISDSTSRAAAMKPSTSAGVCASEMNAASNCAGGSR